MSQEMECSWLHAHCTALTASSLLWRWTQKGGNTSQALQVFRRNLKRPQGGYFNPKVLCKETGHGYRQRTPF